MNIFDESGGKGSLEFYFDQSMLLHNLIIQEELSIPLMKQI